MYTYGPVPSRRLGKSLGVSPIPYKTCSYSCVYCQLGKTIHLRIKRQSFFPKHDILEEIAGRTGDSAVDYITIVGDGEPTLSLDIGWIIRKCKERFSLPVAVITNGSLLFREDVRKDLYEADTVIPSLDAGNRETFKFINRPHGLIDYELMYNGLRAFRKEFSGQLWMEIMLVEGINDTVDSLLQLRSAIYKLSPDRLYLMSPTRPPAESWVKPPTSAHMIRARKIIGSGEPVAHREEGRFGISLYKDASQAIEEIGSRHPLRIEQALAIEKEFDDYGVVEKMIQDKRLVKTRYENYEYVYPASLAKRKLS